MRRSDLAHDIRHYWLTDPEFRAEWREYLLRNLRSNTRYFLAQGIITSPQGVPAERPGLEAHRARKAARDYRRPPRKEQRSA